MDQNSPAIRHPTTEPVLRSRLLPKISFQSLLLLTALSAIVIAVAYAADQGGSYASAALVGLTFLAGMSIISATLFLLAWAVSYLPRGAGISLITVGVILLAIRLLWVPTGAITLLTQWIALINFQVVGLYLLLMPIGRDEAVETESPFAAGQMPPQILAPRDPVN